MVARLLLLSILFFHSAISFGQKDPSSPATDSINYYLSAGNFEKAILL
ncbi:hypothetical protein MNBD_GAMMA03-2062, partial [hydrothermal vent metagenome]